MEENKKPNILVVDDTQYETELSPKFLGRKPWQRPNPNLITAYIPGVIQKVYVGVGQRVKRGDSLLILEAMKMKNDVTAPNDGIIKAVHIKEGQMVPKNALLITIE